MKKDLKKQKEELLKDENFIRHSAYYQFYENRKALISKNKTPKKRKGKLLTVTLNVDVAEKFDTYCTENAHNKSKLIESLMMKYIAEQEGLKK